MKTLCFQEKKNLLAFPHDCGTIIASRNPSPVPGKIAGLAGICIIVFRAIVGGFGLRTQGNRLATCPEQMGPACVQHYYLFLCSVVSESWIIWLNIIKLLFRKCLCWTLILHLGEREISCIFPWHNDTFPHPFWHSLVSAFMKLSSWILIRNVRI